MYGNKSDLAKETLLVVLCRYSLLNFPKAHVAEELGRVLCVSIISLTPSLFRLVIPWRP